VELYDLANRKRLWRSSSNPWVEHDPNAPVAVGPGGRMVLTWALPNPPFTGSLCKLWDTKEQKEVAQLRLTGSLTTAAFSPDGKTVLTATRDSFGLDERVRLWDAATGKALGEPLVHRGKLWATVFSPDGKLVLIAGGEEQLTELAQSRTDGRSAKGTHSASEAQLVSVSTGKPVGRPFRQESAVLAAAFSPDGEEVVTGGCDGIARRWSVRPIHTLQPVVQLAGTLALSADATRALVRPDQGSVRLYEVETGRPCGEPLPIVDKGKPIVLSPNGTTVLSAEDDNSVRQWDARTGKPITVLHHRFTVVAVCFIDQGRTILTMCVPDGQADRYFVELWDAGTGKAGNSWEQSAPDDGELAVSPNGRFALRRSRGAAILTDQQSQKQGGQLQVLYRGRVTGGTFSPDSETLLTIGGRTGAWEEALLWKMATAKVTSPPLQHQGPIRAIAFSPDGKLIVTGSEDRTARFWATDTGQPVGPPLSHVDHVLSAAFSPDGRLALTGGADGSARLWDIALGKPIGPPLTHTAPVEFVAFSSDGRRVITLSRRLVSTWSVPPPLEGDIKHLLLRVQTTAGMELNGNVPRALELTELMERRQLLEESSGAYR
jgi:WD40 repeat protein